MSNELAQKEILNKPSGLITLRHTLKKQEHKLYNAILKIALDKLKEISSNNGTFTSSFSELKELTGLTQNHEVKKTFETLMDNRIEFKDTLMKGSEKRWNVNAHFLSSWYYSTDESVIKFQIPTVILDLLKEEEFKNVYARLNLKLMSNLNYKHSLWLYEVITDYKRIGSITYDIQSIRDLAGLKDTQYSLINDLKRKVIDKAVAEINKKTAYTLKVSANKKGRKIDSYTFKFFDNSASDNERKKYFRMWLHDTYQNNPFFATGFGEIYLSTNKSGSSLVFDYSTRKPFPREISYEIFDYLYQERERFYIKMILPGLEDDVADFEAVLDEYIKAKKFDELGGKR